MASTYFNTANSASARRMLYCRESYTSLRRARATEIHVHLHNIKITRNHSLSNIGRARCAAINSDFFKIIISKYINYTIGINDNNCVFVCNLILGW